MDGATVRIRSATSTGMSGAKERIRAAADALGRRLGGMERSGVSVETLQRRMGRSIPAGNDAVAGECADRRGASSPLGAL